MILKAGDNSVGWDYGEFGPDAWSHMFLECNGENQSPINIKHTETHHRRYLVPFKFSNYDYPIYWDVKHNGQGSLYKHEYVSSSSHI